MTIKFLTLSSESELHSPALDLLAPLHVNSPLPVPLICLASGLNDTGRVKVDWEVDSEEDVLKELSPTILPDTRAGVFNSQVYVPAETWSAGVNVSCVLSDGELRIRKTISSRTDEVKRKSLSLELTPIWRLLVLHLYSGKNKRQQTHSSSLSYLEVTIIIKSICNMFQSASCSVVVVPRCVCVKRIHLSIVATMSLL